MPLPLPTHPCPHSSNTSLAPVPKAPCGTRCRARALRSGWATGASEAAPAAVRQAVGGGCRSGWGQLLSVTNAIEAGTCRLGDTSWASAGRPEGWGGVGGAPVFPMPSMSQPDYDEITEHEREILEGRRRLQARLARLQIEEDEMVDDGNCLFRAVSHQIYGSQKFHLHVRSECIRQLSQARHEYCGIYFETKEDFEEYVGYMAKPGTWGDEVALKAISDIFKLQVAPPHSRPPPPFSCRPVPHSPRQGGP